MHACVHEKKSLSDKKNKSLIPSVQDRRTFTW
jgi:hypothetical protein